MSAFGQRLGPDGLADCPVPLEQLAEVLSVTEGMASISKLAVLAGAAQMLPAGQAYVEIGTYTGASAIAAALGNPQATIHAVDNFSEFGGPIDAARANLARFGCTNVELHDESGWDFLRRYRGDPIGVYFYDGRHTFRDQWRALNAVLPHLADEALVIIDDASAPRVALANRLFARGRDDLTVLARYHSPVNRDPKWWNGVDVFGWTRTPGARTSRLAVVASVAGYLMDLTGTKSRVPPSLKRLARRTSLPTR